MREGGTFKRTYEPQQAAAIVNMPAYLCRMLTDEEKEFVDYWEQNRLLKKKTLKQLSVGLPFGVIFVLAIFINFFSGWDKRAQMIINTDPSIIIVLLIGALLIVTFFVIFSARHRWDLNEQRYRELIARRDRESHP